MAITKHIPNSLLLDLFHGTMDFQIAGDTFKIALYYATALLGDRTETVTYTTNGEVVGTGYTAGGETLTNVDPVISSNVAIMDWADVTFSTVTLTNVAGAMIYNSSQSDATVAMLKFDPLITAVAQDITIAFPGATSTSAILRIKQKV